MTLSDKRVWGTVAVLIVLAGGLATWHFAHQPSNPLTDGNGETPAKHIGNFDQFQQDLAARVLAQFGDGSSGTDFSVIVATTAYPIGTLLRRSGSVPADFGDCVPQPLPKIFPATHLFPSYTMSSDTAVTANLSPGVVQAFGSIDSSLRHTSRIQYTIADSQIQIMDDKSVQRVTGQGDCGAYIATHPGMRLVRGAVIGKITFTVQVDNPASVKAELIKIGGINVQDNPQSSTLSVADVDSQPIVQLLSQFETGASPSKPTSTSPPPVPSVDRLRPVPKRLETVSTRPPDSANASNAHIFLQQDAQDNSDAATKVVQALRAAWPSATVENAERIPTQKMPPTAQVRYFNSADLASATRCVGILKQIYPDIRAVRIGLPSPDGQLEVWLARKR